MPYADPDTRRAYQREWVAARRAAFFEDACCAWCGAIDDLELHHRDPAKKVAHSIWSWSRARRLTEITKCIVVCGPCHDAAHREAQKIEADLRDAHGTVRRYWRGCRCLPCRKARSEYERTGRQAA